MRIAMVGHKRVPSREGGIEVVVEELAARMVMHGHSVTCYNRTGHHVSGKEYDIEHLDEYRGILHSRRHLAASPVFKGIPNFRETRIAMLRAETVDELFAILERAREAVRQVTD